MSVQRSLSLKFKSGEPFQDALAFDYQLSTFDCFSLVTLH